MLLVSADTIFIPFSILDVLRLCFKKCIFVYLKVADHCTAAQGINIAFLINANEAPSMAKFHSQI